MPSVMTFADALSASEGGKRHLLLGNGFSIAIFPDRFRYGSLLEQADFSSSPKARQAFTALGTTDFEVVIKALRDAVTLLPIYSSDEALATTMRQHADVLKDLLVRAIAGRHPERPSDVGETPYKACRTFLAHFVGESRDERSAGGKDLRGYIYTVNYDLLLYWTLLHDQVIQWNAADPLASVLEQTEALQHDDGFRAPDADPNAPYVTWDAEGAADGQNIHFLHGALHLYDDGPDLQKKCWERSGGIPLVDQLRAALAEDKFPLFVSEGDSGGKLLRIRHSGYLQRSLKSFAGVCRSPGASLFIFGHSLAPNDEHVLRQIEKGKTKTVYVSLYGDPASDANRTIVARAARLALARPERNPLEVQYFSAESAAVWA
ncbi:MAG: DUF4917 family protein [Rhodospirillales bacterium]|nr:DUF4917 family protein [Rhodospirillales bacterium]